MHAMGSHFLPTFSWNVGKCPKSIPRPDSHLQVWVVRAILNLMGGRQGSNKSGHKTKDHAFRDNHSRFSNFSNAMPESWTLGLPTVIGDSSLPHESDPWCMMAEPSTAWYRDGETK